VEWQKKKSQACVTYLPSLGYFQRSQPCTFLLAFAFLVIAFWSKECVITGIERPYELRVCDKRDWHSVQDEEHISLDCQHEHLVSIRTQHRQLVFPPQYEDSPTRLRTFLNQPDIFGVASFVAECLALFPWLFLISFWFFSGFFQASAQMPPRGIYSDVTLPYLIDFDLKFDVIGLVGVPFLVGWELRTLVFEDHSDVCPVQVAVGLVSWYALRTFGGYV